MLSEENSLRCCPISEAIIAENHLLCEVFIFLSSKKFIRSGDIREQKFFISWYAFLKF